MPITTGPSKVTTQRTAYFIAAAAAIAGATGVQIVRTVEILPVIGTVPFLPVTAAAAVAGFFLSVFLEKRGVAPAHAVRVTPARVLVVFVLGGLLALPPIAIDVAIGFPEELNLRFPEALFFYPGIALVAEVAFHLLPLALLSLPFRSSSAPRWVIWPVVFVEPIFQLFFISGPPLMSLLVLGNVTLISAVQLWLYRRHGFLAMIGLRWAFYLFWHILWGQMRLVLLF